MDLPPPQPRLDAVLESGDPRRRAPIGRAVLGTLLASATFVGFAYSTKQVRGLYLHTPWQDDPFDAVVSFTIFFVPLVAGLCLLRVPLCRRDEPLPVQRVLDLLRGSRVALGAVVITLLTDWISIVLRNNQATWTAATALSVALLALATIVTSISALDLRRASKQPLPAIAPDAAVSDWFSDILLVAKRRCVWLGPLQPQGIRFVRFVERHVVSGVRRHPVAAAAAAATGFGVTVAAAQSIEEGLAPVALLVVGVGACGMFAFVMVAGAYLGVIRKTAPVRGVQRRAIDAAVAASASVPLALAFRGWLWWIVASSEHAARPWQLTELMVVVAIATALLVFCGESLAQLHSEPAILRSTAK